MKLLNRLIATILSTLPIPMYSNAKLPTIETNSNNLLTELRVRRIMSLDRQQIMSNWESETSIYDALLKFSESNPHLSDKNLLNSFNLHIDKLVESGVIEIYDDIILSSKSSFIPPE